jgi:hypothetical protein
MDTIKKLIFSLVISLVLVVTAVSVVLFLDTPSPVLAELGGEDPGDGDDHPDEGDDHPDEGGDSGGEHGDGPHPGDGEETETHPFVEEDVRALMRIQDPEGQTLGPVQNIRDHNGNIIMTEDGVPLLGRPIYDAITGEPVKNYDLYSDGWPIYISNVGRISVPVTYHFELGPGLRSGPGYERFKYTPPPGVSYPEDQEAQTQDSTPAAQTTEPGNQGNQTPEPLPPAPIPQPNIQNSVTPPAKTFGDAPQFSEPQPVSDPDGNPRANADGTPVLGRTVLDEAGIPVIGPGGKPIIVIPD